jgi:hypothetical protein
MSGICGTLMGDMRNAYIILVGKPKGKRLLFNLGLDGRIILKWISKRKNVKI